jgi:RimJ/RimL family protein N-acetyltransferase
MHTTAPSWQGGRVELRTDRLRIRPWHAAEAPRVLATYSLVEVVRGVADGDPRPMETLDQADRAIARWAEHAETPPRGVWAVEVAETGVVAGTVLLVGLPGDGADVEIAWHLHPDSWGHGYATEAAAAVLAHGFAGGLREIYALTHLGHDRSQAVCRRIGLRYRGRQQSWYSVAMEVFALTADEYGRRPG